MPRRLPRTVISAGYRSLDDLSLEKVTTERFSATTNACSDGKINLINGIYRGIFRNAYLYDADEQALSVSESALRKGIISVMDFCVGSGQVGLVRQTLLRPPTAVRGD
ncbi:hypothetical protein MMPV_005143 [Pyropia vietnamensis]